jgi:hypothetical protein
MRQQITAEVRASFPETTSNTFATQLHHQVEKAVITRTKTLQSELDKTTKAVETQSKTIDSFTSEVDEKINNLAFKTVTIADNVRKIQSRVIEMEDNTTKRINSLRQAVDGNSRNIAELSSITSTNNEALEDNTKKLSILIETMFNRTPTQHGTTQATNTHQDNHIEDTTPGDTTIESIRMDDLETPIEEDDNLAQSIQSFTSDDMQEVTFEIESNFSPRRKASKRQGEPLVTQEDRVPDNNVYHTPPTATTTTPHTHPTPEMDNQNQEAVTEDLPASAPVGL